MASIPWSLLQPANTLILEAVNSRAMNAWWFDSTSDAWHHDSLPLSLSCPIPEDLSLAVLSRTNHLFKQHWETMTHECIMVYRLPPMWMVLITVDWLAEEALFKVLPCKYILEQAKHTAIVKHYHTLYVAYKKHTHRVLYYIVIPQNRHFDALLESTNIDIIQRIHSYLQQKYSQSRTALLPLNERLLLLFQRKSPPWPGIDPRIDSTVCQC